MEKYPFIFSDEKKYRIRRHLMFWTSWWLFTAVIYSFGYGPLSLTYGYGLMRSVIEAFIFLPTHIFLAYSIMYFVIPRFLLKGKYVQTAELVGFLFALCAVISITLNVTIINAVRNLFEYKEFQQLPPMPLRIKILYGLMAGLRGGITIGGLAAAIKLMKYWYVKEQRNTQLQKENLASQLQLLKAQVHPHFLFNTLNNIYSHTQKVSPTASSLVIGLSDLLRYILHEGSRQWVPLSSELKMINDYITLEQIRYGKRLEIDKELPADTNGLMIAPLLLLPFVENCFKHGTSQMLDQAWIRLSVEVDKNKLKMTLVNARSPMAQPDQSSSGIGIANVRKRLELLYPGKHELVITEEEDVFIVNLRIELETKFIPLPEKEIKPEPAHA
jgi:sensor histidine kinase YesM